MDNRESVLLEMQKVIRKEANKKDKMFRSIKIENTNNGVDVKMMGMSIRFERDAKGNIVSKMKMSDGYAIDLPSAESEFLRQLFLDGSRMTPAEFRDSRAGKATNFSPAVPFPASHPMFDVVWNALAIRLGIDPVAQKGQTFTNETIEQLKQDELAKAHQIAAENTLGK